MDLSTVYSKTAKGVQALAHKGKRLPASLARALSLVDGRATVEEILEKAGERPTSTLPQILADLANDGYLKTVIREPLTQFSTTPDTSASMVVSETVDETFFKVLAETEARKKLMKEAAANPQEARRKAQEKAAAMAEEEAMRQKNEARKTAEADEHSRQEAVRRKIAEVMAQEEAAIKARREADILAHQKKVAQLEKEKAEIEERARREAQEKAAREAEIRAEAARKAQEAAATEERARQAAEQQKIAAAKAREEAERKAREEAESRALREKAEKESADAEERARKEALEEAAAKEREREIAEARAKAAAEEKIRVEARAREEAERIKAREEAEARAQAEEQKRLAAEAENRARLEAEENARAEEAARIKAEAEARAREKAESKAREEAKAREKREAEARAIAEAEEKARDEEAARIKAENEARAREEAEARAIAEAEERTRREAEDKIRAQEEAQAKARAEAERKAREGAVQDERERAEIESQARALADARALEAEKARQKELAKPKKLKRPVKWGKAALISLAALILLPLVLLQVMSLNLFIPSIEKLASDRMREPVFIDSLRASLWPAPHLRLDGVSIGKLRDIKIPTVRVTPELAAFFGETKTIKSIEVESLAINQDAIAKVITWVRPDKIQVRRITLKAATIEIKNIPLPALEADIALTATGELERANIRSADKKIEVAITPKSGGLEINIAANDWHPPFWPNLTFTELRAKAMATSGSMRISEIEGRLYSGRAKGSAAIKWGDLWSAEGDLEIENVLLAEAQPALTDGIALSGKLDAKSTYSMQAKDLETLFDKPRIKASFNVRDGSIGSIDLARAIQPRATETTGGKTLFASLSGNMTLESKHYQYRQMKLAAGLLSASGEADIMPNKHLSGKTSVEMKLKSSPVSASLGLSGDVKRPVLRR